MTQKRARITLLAATTLAALALPAGLIAQSDKATTISRVDLRPLNGSSAQGRATLRLSSDQRTLTVSIRASGLEPGGQHISHIHGRSESGTAVDSTCPTQAEDRDGDGFVELEEGGVRYGPILIDFVDVDPDKDGNVDFERTIRLTGAEMALPLELRHIVVHGMTVPAGPGAGTPGEVNGENGYLTVLPVLCGEIEQVGNGRRNPR